MEKNKAKESHTIKRLRNRLKKHLVAQESQVTPEALAHMSTLIRDLLSRKLQARKSLKTRTFEIFDQNRHPAQDERATLRLREMVKRDYFHL